MGLVQIVKFTTSRADEFNALLDEWLERTERKRTATRGVQTRDWDHTNTYVQIVEFPSYEEAKTSFRRRARSLIGLPNCATVCRRSGTSTSPVKIA